MSTLACEIWSQENPWSASGGWQHSREWSTFADPEVTAFRQPSEAYSKRSTLLAKLRGDKEWATAHADDEIAPPSDAAMESAKEFINSLSEGCLNIRLAVSSRGEINFFIGTEPELFQILIETSGQLSYYGETPTGVLEASAIDAAAFPHMELLKFVDRHK